MNDTPKDLTECRRFFGEPRSPRQRQYEALRAFFVEGLASTEAAKRFGYAPGTFRVLCHAFRRDELPEFFTAGKPGPTTQPKKSAAHEQIVALRKRNYSIYEISQQLKEQGTPLSPTAVGEVLAAEGFARLPRRRDDERPARVGPTVEPVADVRSFSLTPREFTTRVGGLFLFIPDLVRFDVKALARRAKLPGSQMIPPLQGLLAALGLKLWSIERKRARPVLRPQRHAEEELSVRILLAHHTGEGRNPAWHLAPPARRRQALAWTVLQPRLPFGTLFWGSSRR